MQIYRFFTRFAYFTRTTNINSFHNKRYIRNTYKLLNKSSTKFKYIYLVIYIERSNFFQITQIYDRKISIKLLLHIVMQIIVYVKKLLM